MKELSDTAIMGINFLVLAVAISSIGVSLESFTTLSPAVIGLVATLGGLIIMVVADIILWRVGLLKSW